MNRQAKRMMQRQKTTAPDRVEAARQRRSVTTERRQRTPFRKFFKEVRAELKRVAWPNRREMAAYTVVVLVAVVVLTSLVFGLDFAFSKGVLHVFGTG